jgi:protein-S-isoprenylcysteine O-methyltransferase Ste14
MDWIPGLSVLAEKAPELTTPRGLVRAAVIALGTFAAGLIALLWLESWSLFAAFLLQLVILGVNFKIVEQVIFGRQQRRPYADAFFGRFLPAAGLNFASIGYVLFTGAGFPPGEHTRLVHEYVGGALALYLVVTGLLLLARSIHTAGVDTLALVYSYHPDEGRQLTDATYDLLRHPVYAGLDRIVLAFAMWNGSAYSVLLAVLFVFVWHPLWYHLEEQELLERFGDDYRQYRERVPAVFPSSLQGELALLEAATRRPVPRGE